MKRYELVLKRRVKGTPNLHGATLGQEHRKQLCDELVSSPELAAGPGALVVIDFGGINSATASYVKAVVFALIRAGIRFADPQFQSDLPPLNVFPVVTGASVEIVDELNEVATSNGLVCLEAIQISADGVSKARLLGAADPSITETLLALTRESSATATQLMEQNLSTAITVNGWNNRLADLYRLRLAARERLGRQWIYAPIAKQVIYG